MAVPMTTTDLKSILTFPFAPSEGRQRFALGAALVLAGYFIPVVPVVLVAGYLLQVMRGAAAGEEPALPAWHDWRRLGIDGLRAMAVFFVFLLPGTLIWLLGIGVYFVMIAGYAVASSDSTEAALLGLAAVWGGVAVFYLAMALATLLLIVGAAPLPMALAHLVTEDRLTAALRPRQWWPLIRAAGWDYVAGWVVVSGLMAITYLAVLIPSLTLVLCCLVPILAAPLSLYTGLAGAAFFGSIAHQVRVAQTGPLDQTPARMGDSDLG